MRMKLKIFFASKNLPDRWRCSRLRRILWIFCLLFGADAGAELTISGFTATYGNWISIFTAVALCCFAFSTIIGWGLYGARCIEFLFSSKVIKPFMLVYSLVAILGATVDLGMLWSIAETFNGLMAIPNLIALFLLSGTVVKLVKEYFHEK